MKKKAIIYDDKKLCCGCGVCALVCPKQAIVMEPDSYGFIYPHIKKESCISCGLCERACAFQKQPNNNMPEAVYALSRKDTQRLIDSASGGVFAGIAEQWIEQGGVVYGVALLRRNGTLTPCHTMAETTEELLPLLGSKYVQSDLGTAYSHTKNLLDSGRKVLFSGMPCQVAGLKSWLKKDYVGLLTVDLVCHGVPSAAMFQDYLAVESQRTGYIIEDFRFRDKGNEGYNARMIYSDQGKQCSVRVPSNKSSYYELFLHGEIFRENCYHCPYANAHHPADLTIGDYWGIEQEHPSYLTPDGTLDQKAGISMVMVNTAKGAEAFETYKDAFWYYPSTFECVSKHNEQLNHPSSPGSHREELLRLYQKKGYRAVERWYWKQRHRANRKEWVLYHLHHDVPEPVRNALKKIIMNKEGD
ncbi:MAG: Coenzyme F420 hydrogenase/dehydrogenase, beta subunit C-terminal domain [Lachnospiraceae bacterium]